MLTFRKYLFSQVCSTSQFAECTLTAMGIIALLVGLLVMPSLEMTVTGFYLGLLALVAFMVLCFCAGQLIVIRQRLDEQSSTD